MRFVNFSLPEMPGRIESGLWLGDMIVPAKPLFGLALPFAIGGDTSRETLSALPRLADEFRTLPDARIATAPALDPGRLTIHPPVMPASSFRDFYAFEAHVKNARARRGLPMLEDWFREPVFYFSNHRVFQGHNSVVKTPPGTEWLDYELEIGCVIGTPGIDIAPADAEKHIAGYFILNDWSARDVQRHEMKVGLGPAKGKDFATSIGPALVTPDELEARRAGHAYDCEMTATVNGRLLSRGNWKDIHWGFAELIARASRGVMLYPGDVIGSGTVGTGCILELGPENTGGWLKPGDRVELTVEGLGTLVNTIG